MCIYALMPVKSELSRKMQSEKNIRTTDLDCVTICNSI